MRSSTPWSPPGRTFPPSSGAKDAWQRGTPNGLLTTGSQPPAASRYARLQHERLQRRNAERVTLDFSRARIHEILTAIEMQSARAEHVGGALLALRDELRAALQTMAP